MRLTMRRSGGYNLIELTVIVSLLGFLATLMVPSAAPYQEQKLDLAATELANALRFTRVEAIRTGQYRAIKINKHTGQVSVGLPQLAGGEVTGFQSLTYNPIDKKIYEFNANTLSQDVGVRIDPTNAPFTFKNLTGARDTCLFDAEGNPLLISTGASHALTAGAIVLQNGLATRSIAVSLVGRVSVQ